jgi:hypothetical protein
MPEGFDLSLINTPELEILRYYDQKYMIFFITTASPCRDGRYLGPLLSAIGDSTQAIQTPSTTTMLLLAEPCRIALART